jgi:hypothetical protein
MIVVCDGMNVWIKNHGEVLAACDENLAGKTFEEGTRCLHVKKDFYCGELVEEGEFWKCLADSKNINLVGENTVRIAKNQNLINQAGKIDNVPYAVIFRV